MDTSYTAIERLKADCEGCNFVCADFVNADEVYATKYDICYSRFSIHAINLFQEKMLIDRVYQSLNPGGLFCIEVRSIHDDLFGKGEKVEDDAYIYNNHYRRFIRMESILMRLMDKGFLIKYAEENTGFAPFDQSDPKIIRIVCMKDFV